MFNAIRYFRDRRIDYATEGPKCSQGWVNIHCPFCRSADKHLGFNLVDGYFHCWHGCRIGSIENFIMVIERIPYHEACRVALDYDEDFSYLPITTKKKALGVAGKIIWPPGTVAMQPQHKAYLKSRNFDPDYLEQKYNLMGTLAAGPYASRIMVPIFFDGIWISYQGRDITGNAALKYKACRKELELLPHDEILYNLDNAIGNIAVVVEGVFDVWRLGNGAVATFGTSIVEFGATTHSQVGLLATRFTKVFTMFDAEPPAQIRAKKLRDWLAVLGVESVNIKLSDNDPGDLSQDDADRLMGELFNEKKAKATVKI